MSRDVTKIERRDSRLPPLVPELEWNVPDPTRAEAPEYESYEVVWNFEEKQQLLCA